MKNFYFKFHIGRRKPKLKQWAIYSLGTCAAAVLTAHFGTMLLQSERGEFARDLICSASRVFQERLLSVLCRTAESGIITEDDARKIIGRAQQAVDAGSELFDNDRVNTDLRAEDEVDFAIEGWGRQNPAPKIDPKLKREFPEMTEEQLCVLSQAERYVDGNAIGIRYVGMSVCEDE